ncbi:MAG TPA: hypothetical protein DGB85_02265 [Deltaproteobacteria bacterium]|nr:hypothetical protein [Deltaproteobacteria bacterium]
MDYVVISHEHYDHLDMRSIQFFQEKRIKFLVPLGIKSRLTYWEIPAERIIDPDW